MQTLDGRPLADLYERLDRLRAALASPLPGSAAISIPIPPIRLPHITTLMRGTTIIGYVITPFGAPAPTAANVILASGTLWVEATLLGAAFTSTPGFAGIPFASAKMSVTGSVTFGGGQIVLSAAATLSFAVASATIPATQPTGDPIGRDFLAATLTPFPHATTTLAPAGATIALSGGASATLYGQSLALTPASGPTPARVDFTTPHVAIPCSIAQTTFAVARSASPEVVMAGKAPIVGSGVVFPILTAASPGALPAPGDAWGIVVVTGAGLAATIAPLSAPLALAGASFALTPVRLVGLVANGAARARESYQLWVSPPPPSPAPPLALPPSQMALDLGPGALISFSAAPNEEITLANGTLDAVIDRPVDAGGRRIPLRGPALFTRVRTTAAITVDVGSMLTPAAKTSLALIAENALIPVSTPNSFLLSGTLSQERIAAGGLAIGFPARAIVPTFPDPYVAAYSAGAGRELLTGVAALVAWTATTAPALTINVIHGSSLGASPVPAPPGNIPTAAAPVPEFSAGFRLLDVSSNADQWGIAIETSGGAQFSFAGLQLQAPAHDTAVFTVPGISWEPVVDASAAPAWLAASSPDDGTPTTFLVAVTEPAPIVPVLALEKYQAAAGTHATQAAFTLPFGIKANLSEPTPGAPGPAYAIPSVQFPDQGLAAARVLSITGAPAPPGEATLPGTAITGYNATPPAYGAQVLGIPKPSVADLWDQDFGPTGVGHFPVGRVDLSGYGTSLFSDWHDPNPLDPGIIRALFNVLLGRTAHEIITAQIWVLPWCVRLQRTITFDRSDGGEVVKHDTGWKAVGPGKFELLTSPKPSRLLAGPVAALNNVRNIRFSTATVTVGPITYTPCTFDADVSFLPSIKIAADGKNPAPFSVGTAIQGYAQDTITSSDPNKLSPAPPSANDIIALMQQQGRVSGSTGCIARIGGTGAQQFTMTVSSFGAAVAAGTTPMLQTALFGTPRLPKDGQWSVAKRASNSLTPQAVDAHTPVPLTQGTSAGTTVPTGVGTFAATCFRLLDPEDAQQVDAPNTLYSIMQGTGTSKTLYEHPLINDAGTGIGFNKQPGLADVGALLGVASIFPDIGSALQIPSTDGLPLQGDGFTRTYTWGPGAMPPSPAPPDRAVLDIAIVHMVLSYKAFKGTLTLDAASTPSSWSLSLENLSFIGNVDGFGTLLTLSGGFQAGTSISPGFTGLDVTYGPALDPVKAILTGLSGIAASLGGDAELDVGFSGNTLSVQQGFTLPTIPLGFGEITDLGLHLGFSATIPSDLSFSVGIGSKQQPFQWVVSPLAGTGAIVLGVQGGGLDVYLEAGLGLGLSISVAVASGSASIVVSLSLEIQPNQVQIGAALTGNAQVDVLGGLASASLTLTAAITITIETPPAPQSKEADLAAQVSVGIHISICWIISISFDGSWGFSEQISL